MSFKDSIFAKQIAKLATGTALAQLINIISLPLLTRLYTPSQFGIFAVFLASVAVLSSISTLKYENAILDEEEVQDAKHCTALTALSGIFIVAPLLFYSFLAYYFDFSLISIDWLTALFLSIAIILTNVFTALYYWCNRLQHYGFMTRGRVFAAVAVAFFSLLVGYLEIDSVNGLIVGSLFGMAVNAVYLILKLKLSFSSIRQLPLEKLYTLSIKLKRFPLFLVPSTLLDRLAAQVHIFVFSSVFGNSIAGAMGVYNRVVGLPTSLIGNAVGDVYKRRISELLKARQSCRRVFIKTGLTLFTIAAPISCVLFFFAPELFTFVLGEQWKQAGEITSFLSINFLLAFVISPLAGILYLRENQRIDLLIQIVLVVSLAIGMAIAVYENSFKIALSAYAISFGVKYLVQLLVSFKLAK
ncbi:lipopolysaccharide biosynthesis protein [Pseudoalteromonas phenolica]|nr:oligosaccharide flippase family protein [Pseudoalteromonas phenolica]